MFIFILDNVIASLYVVGRCLFHFMLMVELWLELAVLTLNVTVKCHSSY